MIAGSSASFISASSGERKLDRIKRPRDYHGRARVIVLSHVKKSFGRKEALARTDLTIEGERCLALVGPSGSGKSTILRLVLGLVIPDEGTITIAGEALDARTASAARLRMGYVIQDGGLFPHLNAEENAVIVARQNGFSRERAKARLGELIELVGLSAEHLRRYPVELSGGERQRVGLMRALMLDPPILLFDEPLAALDPMIRARLQEDLRRIFRELRKTVLFVTHDLAEAAFVANEIALLHDGKIVQKGTLAELMNQPKDAFVTEFFQAQRVNIFSPGEAR
jgi:osmoprotectant transport system ATP-binding protein